jgi:hypothetical protein
MRKMARSFRRWGKAVAGIGMFMALSLAAFIPAVTAGQGIEGLQVLAEYTTEPKIYLVGDVQKVLSGTVTAGDMVTMDPTNILFSLGAGSFDGEKGVKEMMVFNGTVYLKGQKSENNYALEKSKAVLNSPFTFGIKKGAMPHKVIYYESATPMALEDIYVDLMTGFDHAFAIFGIALFDQAQTTALKTPPIYNEPISTPENSAKYFLPVGQMKDQTGFFFGLVVDPNKEVAGGRYDKGKEQKMFYVSFAQKGPLKLQSHTHILLPAKKVNIPKLTDPVAAIQWVGSQQIRDIEHLVTSSKVRKALFLLYDVQGYVDYTTLAR